MRKIDLMHNEFGLGDGQCKDCQHLLTYRENRTYRKCKVYGISHSAATDWKLSSPACGLFPGKTWSSNKNIVDMQTKTKKDENIEGQISLIDFR